jgi:proline iminopeptidase
MKSKFYLLAFVLTTIFFSCTKEKQINDSGNLVMKTVEENLTLPSISVNGTKLHAETFGNPTDPMVIFLHGGPGADYRNGLNVKQLSTNGFYVIFYDQRGAGLSKRHNRASYNMDLILDDLDAIITYYKTSNSQKVFLFGHSWGGILAGGFINKYPSKINGVIFAEPGGFTYDEIKKYIEKSRSLSLGSETTSDALYVDQFITGKENQHAILDYKYNISSSFTYAKGNATGIEGPSPFWRYGAETFNGLIDFADKNGLDITKNLNQFTPKVLFLYSENNKAYGLTSAENQAKFFQNKQISKVSGTGHEMIFFKWNTIYPIALNYLNSLK